jgi:hypothetical protein
VPIVFEEVTGEIVPEREAPQANAADTATSDGEDIAARMRRELRLMHERERRLRVD